MASCVCGTFLSSFHMRRSYWGFFFRKYCVIFGILFSIYSWCHYLKQFTVFLCLLMQIPYVGRYKCSCHKNGCPKTIQIFCERGIKESDKIWKEMSIHFFLLFFEAKISIALDSLLIAFNINLHSGHNYSSPGKTFCSYFYLRLVFGQRLFGC